MNLFRLAPAALLAVLCVHAVPAAVKAADAEGEIVTVRPDSSVTSKQRLPYFVGISEATANSSGISMNLVVIPPGGAAEPHIHRGYETAIYVLEGEVETRYGAGLAKSVVNRAGDFLFIPADLPHQPRNLSTHKPARAIVARNDPDEQESVVPYDPANPSPASTREAQSYQSETAAKLELPFSDAVSAGGLLFLAGQLGNEPGTPRIVKGGIAAETRQAMDNVGAILAANGSSFDEIVKCTIMLADIDEWSVFNEVYVTYFEPPYPARSAFAADGLALGARVEIECIARR